MENVPHKDSPNTAQTVGVWTKVDQMPDPVFFIQYMDAFNATDSLRAHKQRTLALLNIRTNVQLLDIGCGTGDDVRLLAQQVGPTGKVVGIDPSVTMITETRTRTAGLPSQSNFTKEVSTSFPFRTAPSMVCTPF